MVGFSLMLLCDYNCAQCGFALPATARGCTSCGAHDYVVDEVPLPGYFNPSADPRILFIREIVKNVVVAEHLCKKLGRKHLRVGCKNAKNSFCIL
jgi:hypothetical protein